MVARQRIPNIIHFVYGLDPSFGDKPFMLCHYLAIRSAFEVNRPDKIYFVCAYQPKTDWFEKVKPFIEIVIIKAPTEIFGNPLNHYAHQSDVIRLERLMNYGGIYLDIDTLCVRALTPLLNHNFVMAEEHVYWSENIDEPEQKAFAGLCNAVILGEKNSPFLLKWYNSYKTFRSKGHDDYWSEHSVTVPGQLWREYPDEITVLPEKAFFIPSYDDAGIKMLFEEIHAFPEAYVHHLWESIGWKYLSSMTIETIFNEDTTYNLMARRFLKD